MCKTVPSGCQALTWDKNARTPSSLKTGQAKPHLRVESEPFSGCMTELGNPTKFPEAKATATSQSQRVQARPHSPCPPSTQMCWSFQTWASTVQGLDLSSGAHTLLRNQPPTLLPHRGRSRPPEATRWEGKGGSTGSHPTQSSACPVS